MLFTLPILFISAVLVSTGANVLINRSPNMRRAFESVSQKLEAICGDLDRTAQGWERKLEGVERSLDERFEGRSRGEDHRAQQNDGNGYRNVEQRLVAVEKKIDELVEGLDGFDPSRSRGREGEKSGVGREKEVEELKK